MIYSLSLLSALFFSSVFGGGDYIYYGNPEDFRTYYQAELYCELTHGSTLATIITPEDRAVAIAQIGNGDPPFFGLYSIVSDGWWLFQETLDTCPDVETGRCVDFWIYSKHNVYQPRCIGDDGYYCATFYPGAFNNNGGADNDRDCESPGPFMCNAGTGYESRGYVTDGQIWLLWDEAQQACQANYGTDLATIRTQADFDEAMAVLDAANVPAAWIGLNDRRVEGQFEWVDGSDCEPNPELADGLCTEFWLDNIPDNIDDTNGYNDADCVFINTLFGPGFHRELSCQLQQGYAYLCNLRVSGGTPKPQTTANPKSASTTADPKSASTTADPKSASTSSTQVDAAPKEGAHSGADILDVKEHDHSGNGHGKINYYAYYKVLIINVAVTIVFCCFAIWMVYYCCFKKKKNTNSKYDAVKDETTEIEEI